jgi:hypothetical protein
VGERGGVAPVPSLAACVTVTVLPATLTVPVRFAPLFAATLRVVEPLPLPEAGDLEIHETAELTVQLHSRVVEMLTFFELLPDTADQEVGVTVYEHPDTWLTDTLRPATVIDAVRVEEPVFGVAVTVTEPLPVPAVEPSVSQVALSLAVHPHPAVVEMVMLLSPPPPGSERLVGVTVNAHAEPACDTATG